MRTLFKLAVAAALLTPPFLAVRTARHHYVQSENLAAQDRTLFASAQKHMKEREPMLAEINLNDILTPSNIAGFNALLKNVHDAEDDQSFAYAIKDLKEQEFGEALSELDHLNNSARFPNFVALKLAASHGSDDQLFVRAQKEEDPRKGDFELTEIKNSSRFPNFAEVRNNVRNAADDTNLADAQKELVNARIASTIESRGVFIGKTSESLGFIHNPARLADYRMVTQTLYDVILVEAQAEIKAAQDSPAKAVSDYYRTMAEASLASIDSNDRAHIPGYREAAQTVRVMKLTR